MAGLLSVVEKIKTVCLRISETVSSIFILAMALLITAEVIARFVFNTSTLIATDFSAWGLGIVFYWGACKSFGEGSFVCMDALFEHYHGVFKKIMVLVLDIAFMIYNGIILYYFTNMVQFTISHNSKANNFFYTPLIYPRGIIWIAIVIFMFFLICKFIEDIFSPIEKYSISQIRKMEEQRLKEEQAALEAETVNPAGREEVGE